MAEDFAALFARVRDFDWDPSKRENNLRRRQIDFHDARFVLDGPTIIRRSDRKGETRYMVFGFLDDVEVVFICTIRDETCWIISRRARRDERKKYHASLSRRPAEG